MGWTEILLVSCGSIKVKKIHEPRIFGLHHLTPFAEQLNQCGYYWCLKHTFQLSPNYWQIAGMEAGLCPHQSTTDCWQ